MPEYTIGIDVGGTFTDVACLDGHGRSYQAKTPSTPENQALGVIQGIRSVAERVGTSDHQLLAETAIIVHGTTVATNIMLEWNGARTYMLTTRGFRDIVDLRRNYKEASFSLTLPAPYPIAPRRRRIPISGRVDHAGREHTPLAEEEVRAAAARMGADGAEAVAVCYLFSFLNPAHELRTAEILHELLPGLHISLSHEVLPRIREFERFSTTLVDAYVTPALERYLTLLEQNLRESGFSGDFFIMRSNGGVAEVRRAARAGVTLVASGPAGGVVATSELGRLVQRSNLISMDMGGTSCDVCLIQDSQPEVSTESWVSRYRVGIPAIDVISIGAGGGSIAWVDAGGALRIGPQSAGARPGPACYGLGGTHPTVTDADLILGLINPDAFLGGRFRLDPAAAAEAVRVHVAEPLEMSVEEAAQAIFRIVNHNMANALRLVSVSRGYDPRDFALMAFGGGGPIHASALVGHLGIREILVPRNEAPVLCALGDALSDIREVNARGVYARGSSPDLELLNGLFRDMVERAEVDIGVHAGRFPRVVRGAVALRYKGQTHEVEVPIDRPDEPLTTSAWQGVLESFHRLHERIYSFSRPGVETEVINLQVDRWAVRPKPSRNGARSQQNVPGRTGERLIMVDGAARRIAARVYDGRTLGEGFSAEGPAIIEEPHTSILVLPGQRVSLDGSDIFRLEAES